MKMFLQFTITFILSIQAAAGQDVYVTDREICSDVKVYEVSSEAFADLLVYRVTSTVFTGENEGKWYFESAEIFADKTIYFVSSQVFADLKIYYVDSPVFAKWKNLDKKYLLD